VSLLFLNPKVSNTEVGAGAVLPKKCTKAQRKQTAKKSRSAERYRKKLKFALFLVFTVAELLQALSLTSANYSTKACSKDVRQGHAAWT
jgi:hypothetical protein